MVQKLGVDDIRGIIPPLVSTFDDEEELDLGRFAAELEIMLRSGVRLVVVGGGTGEGDTLTPDELSTLVGAVAATPGLSVVASIITTTQRDALHRVALAKAAGAAALMVAQPMFAVPSTECLLGYIDAIWEASDLPLIFYNHWALSADVVREVAKHPGVIALKEGNIDTIGELTQTLDGEAVVLTGNDPINLGGYAIGAVGAIAGLNTALPEPSVAIYDAFTSGRLADARRIADSIGTLARLTMNPVNFPARMKHAINLQGRDVGRPRRPYAAVSEMESHQLRAALELITVSK